MKKHLLLAALFCLTILSAQNKIAKKVAELQTLKADFKAISVLFPTQNVTDNDVNKVVDGATLATLNLEKVNEIVSNQYGAIELQIPYENQNISLLLYKINPLAEGFHVDTDKGKNISFQKGVYYRGIIKGETESVSAFSFFNGEFNGVFSSSALGNVVVGKLNKQDNQRDYIVYSDAKMKVFNNFECHTKDQGYLPQAINTNTNRSINSDRCVQFYFEVDYNLYQNNGSNLTTATNWITSVFNNVQTLFENDGISTSLKSVFIWTEADPYTNLALTSVAHLESFATTRTVFDGDVGMLIGVDPQPGGSGGLGGVAYLDTLCEQNNYAYGDINFAYSNVPTYSWTINVITHEFGHSLGSPHTHACYWNGNNTAIDGCAPTYNASLAEGSCPTGPIPAPAEKGTIMSYCHLLSGIGISFNNGFGPQPADLILNNVNSKTCLSLDCTTSCTNTVSDITVSNITVNSAYISWTDESTTTTWQVSVTPFSTTTPVWITVTSPEYTVSGLNPNLYYKVKIRPFCDNVEPLIRYRIFATSSANVCNNLTFTDTGINGNYSNMESWTRTMTPYNSGLKLRVTFNSFSLESGYDYLYIYNGPNEFYGDLTLGGLTGAPNPGVYNSTATDGSLTFRFFSDQAEVSSGWNATITCTGTLGTEEANFLDYSYYPNPTTGKVNITSKDAITEVAVYNVQGQLLFTQKMNELTTNVDISQFARGTYFFKLKINDRDANFKILKM